ncbi:DUF736 domain-containing protein (plasmid) [Rhizobium ruizarguesonis]|uniref:DUF736 domain-containing protein n=1 Tax=Rhizobium ruizarguesonis TaxID=2081791 RepID=A0ACD5EGT7_9HYPH
MSRLVPPASCFDMAGTMSGGIGVVGPEHAGNDIGRSDDAATAVFLLMMRRSSTSFSADNAAKPRYGLSSRLVWRRSGLGLQRLRRPSSPLTASGHSSRSNKLGYRRPPLALWSFGCSRPTRRLLTAIETASGGFEQLRRNDNGSDRHLHLDETGAYNGTIKTLTLNVKASIKPCDRDNDRAPDFRVTATGVEFREPAGAGPPGETGAEYLSLKLDDPSFTAPVYASLVQGDKGEHKLIWSR